MGSHLPAVLHVQLALSCQLAQTCLASSTLLSRPQIDRTFRTQHQHMHEEHKTYVVSWPIGGRAQVAEIPQW
ncbi:hypothetical protein B0H11DRAFT_12015 [Mycena galericulata]|nr:hypothetical protein B0H11DRAFT_12015 [Mycena galericulata]